MKFDSANRAASRHYLSGLALLGLALLAMSGRNNPEDPTIPVFGKVTLNGEPVKQGDIVRIFSVPAQANAAGKADALPGDEELGTAASRDQIPPKYNMRSTLTIEVTKEGTNEFNFDIDTSK